MREELRLERERSESIRVRLESELEESCRKIEKLEETDSSTKGLSLKDELDMSSWKQCGSLSSSSLSIRETPIPAVRTTSAKRIQKLIEKIEAAAPTPQPRKVRYSSAALASIFEVDENDI